MRLGCKEILSQILSLPFTTSDFGRVSNCSEPSLQAPGGLALLKSTWVSSSVHRSSDDKNNDNDNTFLGECLWP